MVIKETAQRQGSMARQLISNRGWPQCHIRCTLIATVGIYFMAISQETMRLYCGPVLGVQFVSLRQRFLFQIFDQKQNKDENKIKEMRNESGMTQEELAQKAGVRRETIVFLEQGKYNPSLKLAMEIAKVFKMKVDDLFY